MLRLRFVIGAVLVLLGAVSVAAPMQAQDENCKILDMQVTCSIPEPKVLVGDPFIATAMVTNTGTAKLPNVTLAILGREGTRAVGNPDELSLTIPSLEPGQSRELSATFTSDGVGERRIDASAREKRGWAAAGCFCGVSVEGLPALQVEMIDLSITREKEGVFEVGQEFLYTLDVLNDMGTAITPDLKVVWQMPPELEFVSGAGERGVTVTGSGQMAESSSFMLTPNEERRFELTVRAISVPPKHLVKTKATVQTTAGNELATETESTTLRPPSGR